MYCSIIDMRYAQLPASTIHEQVFTCNETILSAGTVIVAQKEVQPKPAFRIHASSASCVMHL